MSIGVSKLTTVNAEYPIIDDNGERQKVKHIREVGPNVGSSVFPYAFCIEPIRLWGV